jgi:hypothetical protein
MSYLTLGILDKLPAIIICALITTGAFVLSRRYSAQIIAVFALVGGYLPVFAIDSSTSFKADPVMLYGAMVYFIVLNIFVLLISLNKKWTAAIFIGLFLNIFGTWTISNNYPIPISAADRAPLIFNETATSQIYTCIPIISTFRTKANLRPSDIVLLTINTIFSSAIMFAVFYNFDMQDWYGLLAVIFAAIYLIFGKVIQKLFGDRKSQVSALFYITGLAFVVLAVPMQLEVEWVSLGWLAEGILLALYGIHKSDRRFKIAGLVVSMLCLATFLFIDLANMYDDLFTWKYLSITTGSLLVLFAYMYKKLMFGWFIRIYKFFALANIWLFTFYLLDNVAREALCDSVEATAFYINYLVFAALIAITYFYAYVFQRIKLLAGLGIRILSIIFYMIGIIMFFGLNSLETPVITSYLRPETESAGMTAAGITILAVIGVLSVLAVRDIMRSIVAGKKLSIEWYPLIISGYALTVLTQILITQLGFSFASAAISIIYAVTALAWIIYGFSRRFSVIRKFGLGLAVFSVAKLFLADLSRLTQGYQIISYFALGGTLIAISYVYQYFSKRLELKDHGETD